MENKHEYRIVISYERNETWVQDIVSDDNPPDYITHWGKMTVEDILQELTFQIGGELDLWWMKSLKEIDKWLENHRHLSLYEWILEYHDFNFNDNILDPVYYGV
jgi:hypothetical protein